MKNKIYISIIIMAAISLITGIISISGDSDYIETLVIVSKFILVITGIPITIVAVLLLIFYMHD